MVRLVDAAIPPVFEIKIGPTLVVTFLTSVLVAVISMRHAVIVVVTASVTTSTSSALTVRFSSGAVLLVIIAAAVTRDVAVLALMRSMGFSISLSSIMVATLHLTIVGIVFAVVVAIILAVIIVALGLDLLFLRISSHVVLILSMRLSPSWT